MNERMNERMNDIPHKSSIDPHELLVIHHVSLVEHNTYLVVVTSHAFNDATELVRDVELVCVKQQNDTVDTLGHPLNHLTEIVPAPQQVQSSYTVKAHVLRGSCVKSNPSLNCLRLMEVEEKMPRYSKLVIK